MKSIIRSALVVCAMVSAYCVVAGAQDTCDVTFHLDDPGPFEVVTFSADYSAAGGDFVGDSSQPGIGPSWGTEPLACTVFPSGLNEATLLDSPADVLSVLLFDVDGLLAGTASLVSCVLALDGGFPCPDPSAFAIGEQAFPDDPYPSLPLLPPAPAISVSVSPRTPVCGDGFIEGAEECDDDNTADGDCCSSSCSLDAAGTPCPDGSVCTVDETCDGAGACVPASTLVCDDGVFCTHDFCDDTLGCQSTIEPTPHGNSANGCGGLSRTKLLIGDHEVKDARDKLAIRADLRGELGDPVSDTEYGICVFDEQADVPSLVMSITVPAGSPWKSIGTDKGFSYKDSSATSSGIKKIKLKQKKDGTTKLLLLGKGASVPLPGPVAADRYLDADSAVTLQIENSVGECWSERFTDSPKANRVNRFMAKE